MKESFMRMWNGRAGRWTRGTVAGLALLVVAVHVLSTILVNSPNNPVRQKTASTISGYFDPVFSQNWRLFAPNPVNTDRGMLVQARLSSGQVTGYADVTSPEIAEQLHDPLPDRSARQVTRGAGNFMNAISQVRTELSGLKHPTEAAEFTPEQLGWLSQSTRDQYLGARDAVLDVARWHARTLWGPSVTGVQVKLLSYSYPRFSQRDSESATGPDSISQIELPWWPANTEEHVR